MDGSVFPFDIYVYLIEKHLKGRDILRLTMTCKRLFGLYDKRQRLWLVCNRIPPPLSLMYQKREDFTQCPACKVMVKKTCFTLHKRNKCYNSLVWKSEKEDEWEICENCIVTVKKKNMSRHSCVPRPSDVVCEMCFGQCAQYQFEVSPYLFPGIRNYRLYLTTPQCIVYRMHKCQKCDRRFPYPFFDIECEICGEMDTRPYCWFCVKRCGSCDHIKCGGCGENWDPFGVEPYHVCKTALQRVTLKIGGYYWNSKQVGNLMCIATPHGKKYFYVTDSLLEIPSMCISDISILVDENEVCHFVKYGRMFWKVDPPPKHCVWCATTKGPFKRCGGCKKNFYCSADCQRQDWQIHKAECGLMKIF